jgi:uncharacterized protein YcfL
MKKYGILVILTIFLLSGCSIDIDMGVLISISIELP